MRTFTFLLLVFILPNTLNAQNELSDYLPFKNGKIIYSEVVQTNNTSKVKLYKRAKRYLALKYDVIILDDNDKNELIAKGYIYPTLWHTVKIQIKDGRYKYEFTNFRWIAFDVSGGTGFHKNKPFEEYYVLGRGKGLAYEEINEKITDFIYSFITAMETPIDYNW